MFLIISSFHPLSTFGQDDDGFIWSDDGLAVIEAGSYWSIEVPANPSERFWRLHFEVWPFNGSSVDVMIIEAFDFPHYKADGNLSLPPLAIEEGLAGGDVGILYAYNDDPHVIIVEPSEELAPGERLSFHWSVNVSEDVAPTVSIIMEAEGPDWFLIAVVGAAVAAGTIALVAYLIYHQERPPRLGVPIQGEPPWRGTR